MDNSLSKDESLALRGICITMIVLHNLIHNVVPFHENEKWFNISNAEYFLNNITNHPILGSISYLGWLGVPMFFFLSGYGLQKKYGGKIHNQFSFIKKHYLKLLCLAGPIIIINNLHAHIKIVHILGQLTFLNNIPFENNILPAAFWYLRVALQFYILYALFFFRIKPKYLLFSGIVISICFILLMTKLQDFLNITLSDGF